MEDPQLGLWHNIDTLKALFILGGILLLFCVGTGCVDIINRHTRIVGHYYLVEGENQNRYSICVEGLDGALIVKIPPETLQYGYTDSFLVGKTKNYNGDTAYYIIDRKKDFDLAKEKDVRIGPISDSEFNQIWSKKLKVRFIDATIK